MRNDRGSEEKRLVPRYPLPKERVKIFFDKKEKVFGLRDLSLKGVGIGLVEGSEAQLFTLGEVLRVELRLGKKTLPLRLLVKRISPWSIGCEFADPDTELSEQISAMLDPLRIAKSLQKVDTNLSPDAFAAGISAWYHGDSATDLYLWHDARGGVARVVLCLNGCFWEWLDRQRPRTGRYERKAGDQVEFSYDSITNEATRALAAKVLEHQEVLDYRLVSFLRDQM